MVPRTIIKRTYVAQGFRQAPLRTRQARLLRHARAGAPEHRELSEGAHPAGPVGQARRPGHLPPLQGQSVKLDGLGTFRPTIEGKGSNDIETAVSLGANVIIEGIHLRFSPENAKGEKLTSRALKGECAFEFKDVLIRKEKTVDGKKKVYFEKIAVSDYALSQTETTPGGEG